MTADIYRRLAEEPYEQRGIIHSEMAVAISMIRQLGIKRVIESGRARAQSTYILAKYLPDVAVHSIELRPGPDTDFGRNRVHGMMNVTLHVGDGSLIAPVLARLSPEPTAILLDGPKGAVAVDTLVRCFAYPNVRVGFIHDMRKLDHGGPSPHRAYAVDNLPHHVFSDNPELLKSFSHLDENVRKAGGPVNMEAEFGSYGPTLGVFFNPMNEKGSIP